MTVRKFVGSAAAILATASLFVAGCGKKPEAEIVQEEHTESEIDRIQRDPNLTAEQKTNKISALANSAGNNGKGFGK